MLQMYVLTYILARS